MVLAQLHGLAPVPGAGLRLHRDQGDQPLRGRDSEGLWTVRVLGRCQQVGKGERSCMQTWSPFVRKPGTQFPPSSRLCETFQRIALRTEGWLTEGRRPALVPSETSITDLNLFELSKRHTRSVFLRRFTQFDEHTNGSDWEWCIGARSSWYRMRIQAKKLDNFGRHYDCLDDVLDQKTGPAELQITRLIRTAGSMPAIYCLYNGEPDPVLVLRQNPLGILLVVRRSDMMRPRTQQLHIGTHSPRVGDGRKTLLQIEFDLCICGRESQHGRRAL